MFKGNRVPSLKVLLLLLSLLVSSWFFVVPVHADTIEDNYRILILNSYHRGLAWTDEAAEGAVRVIANAFPGSDFATEYMDWKHYPTQRNLDLFSSYMEYKYSGQKLDLVIATDDAALKYALDNRGRLFPDAPVVFSGVNREGAKKLTAGFDRVTGVLEDVDPSDTIRMALEINPGLKNLYVVFDSSESGLSTGELAISAIKRIKPGLNAVAVNNMTYEEITQDVSQISSDSAILITTHYSDRLGRTMEFEEFCQFIRNSSHVPVFHLYDFAMNHGAIGGRLLSGRLQGERAGELAVRVLKGEVNATSPFLQVDTTRNVFDYRELTRFNIPISRIPKGSEILNKPFSFVEEYKELVYSALGTFVLLLGFISVLLLYIRKIKQMQKQLHMSHEELTQLYEELTASDEELKQQFDELAAVRDSLQTSEERYKLVVESINDAIIDWDTKSDDVYFSDRWAATTGYTPQELISMGSLESIIHPDDLDAARQIMLEHQSSREPFFSCRYRVRMKDGGYRWFLVRGAALFDGYGNPWRMIGAHTDIDDLIKAQEKLHRLAYRDSLTGLPNKLDFHEKLAGCFGKADPEKAALLFVDTDNFKLVNDTLGHSFGDSFLIAMGERMASLMTDRSELFRVGGDEFIILLCAVRDTDEAERFAQKIIDAFMLPFLVNGTSLHTSVSIGIALYPEHGGSEDELLMHADIAMYKAKEAGKAMFKTFCPRMDQAVIERLELERQLRDALDNDEFSLHYQPQVNLQTGRVTGLEALLRWSSPALGMVSPAKFIKVAEDCRLIIPIGEWVLKQACTFLQGLHREGYPDLTISVNVSMLQLAQEDFPELVMNTLDEAGLESRFLELEITETILMESFESIKPVLDSLRQTGVRIALDDFGKGYSSLSYLKQLPISTLKIDKLFVDDIGGTGDRESLTGSVVIMGRNAGMCVVAEGVETREQLDYLVKYRCDKMQGYLFSKPIPEAEVIAFIRSSHNQGLPV